MAIQILTVCSGNICRSPMAEQLLRARLAGIPGISVTSAGTVGLVGSPMDERAARLAAEHGSLDAAQHVARELSIEMIREANLVLAMAREHRKGVVGYLPKAARKTFTLREFARIVSSLDGADVDALVKLPNSDAERRIEAAVELVAEERGMAPPVSAEDDDVIDPYRRNDEVFLTSTQQLVPAIDTTSAFIERVARGTAGL